MTQTWAQWCDSPCTCTHPGAPDEAPTVYCRSPRTEPRSLTPGPALLTEGRVWEERDNDTPFPTDKTAQENLGTSPLQSPLSQPPRRRTITAPQV